MTKKRNLFKAFFASAMLTMSAATAAYNPCDPCCNPCQEQSCFGGFDVGVDFIWWKLCRDDLDYAVSFNQPLETTGSLPIIQSRGSYKYLNTKWEPGVRVWLAKRDMWCGIDLLGTYTYINSCRSDSVDKPEDGFLEVTVGNAALAAPFTLSMDHVSAFYRLHYQSADILFATNYCLRQCHNFRPFFGVTGVVINQEQKGSVSADLPSQLTATGSGKWEADYCGVGFKFGSEFNWHICDGFSLFGDGAGMITVGNHRAHSKEYSNTPLGEFASTQLSFNECETILIPGYRIAMGFLYESCLCGMDYGVRLGYEFLEWQNVPNNRRHFAGNLSLVGMTNSPTEATLGFHGLFVGLDLSF